MKKVVICQHRLLHYRTVFFDVLREVCEAKRIKLHLVHGQPTTRENKKRDTGVLPWADVVNNRYVAVGGKDILWQPFPIEHRDADLIIFMQENRLLSNYPWLLLRGLHRTKVAYWGHGRNLQSKRPKGLREKWKKFWVSQVDWWFAYTEMTRTILLSDAFPDERISVLDNAIDNDGFVSDLASITETHLANLRGELGLSKDAQVGLFCGSLYPDKLLDYMIAAADQVHLALPDFHLLVIGDGPSAATIREAGASRLWLHWLGVRNGAEKASLFRLAHVVFNPGAVGLHVLDAFCAGIPMVTTADARHGPEIAYLNDGENGLIVEGSHGKYAEAIIRLMVTPSLYSHLQTGAHAGARRYTLQNMVERFSDGIEKCLIMERKL